MGEKKVRICMRPLIAAALALALSACFEDARLKADTEANFNQSYTEVTKGLSTEEKSKFDTALKDIVLVQIGLYGPLFAATSYKLPHKTSPLGVGLANAFGGAAEQMVNRAIESRWDDARSKAVVDKARPIVDGRTVKEIVQIAQDERKSASAKALDIYKEQLDQAKSALSDVNAAQAEEKAKYDAESAVVAKIIITKPSFAIVKDSFLTKPVIKFSIENKSNVSVKRIFCEGVLQTPGRAVPWVKDTFNYELRGGLEPNEAQELNLAPNMFSDWGKVPQEVTTGAVLAVKLLAFEDASGKRIGQGASSKQSDLGDRKSALENAIAELRSKINSLETGTK